MERFEYNKVCPIDSTPEQRKKYDIGDVFINSAKCLKCDDVIVSKNRHDYVTCKCGALSVDGGSWYTKRAFSKMKDWEDLSIPYNNIER